MNNYPIDIENFHNTMLKPRGGTKIQLQPFALPPVTPYGRQLGTTLKFHIDLFIDGIEETLEPAFEVVSHLNKSLNRAIDIYSIPIKD